MNRTSGLIGISLALALTTGCKSPEQKAAEKAAETFATNMAEAGKKLEDASKTGTANMGDALAAAMGAATGGKQVETVDYKVLKEMLPEEVGGMRRTEATGEKTSAMGMQVSSANGRYQSDHGSMTIKITDIGSMTGLAGMAAYAWAATEVDRESDTGYEKTSSFNGYKSHEKWDKSSKSGEISVLVGNRFVAEVDGNGVEMDALKDALNKVNLKKLDSMKGEGVK